MRSFMVVGMMCLASPLWSALPLSEVLERMEQQQQTIQDARFHFVQRIRRGDFPEERVSGEIQIKKPHALRMVQSTPQKQIAITDGTTLWLYTPSLRQQLKGDWKAWVKHSRFPLLLIDFLGAFTPDRWRNTYKVYFGGYKDHLYELRFKPVRAQDLPLTLWISAQTFLPTRGELREDGVTVQVVLKGIQTNTGIKAELFEPRVPPGTEEVPITF